MSYGVVRNEQPIGGSMDSFFFFKKKTAYEIVSGDWSSDVCSSDLGGVRPLLDEPLPHPGDGGGADVEGLSDALVGPGGAAVGLVGLEQDAGMGQLAGGRLAGGDQVVQGLAFLGGQRHKVFLHRGFLPKEPHE